MKCTKLDKTVHEGAIVPTIWLLETANVLLYAERQQRISKIQAHHALYNLKNLPIAIDQTTLDCAWVKTLELVENYKLTLYDASYLEIALRYNLPLATFDKSLRQACYGCGVVVL